MARQNKLKSISAKDLGHLFMPDFCPRCFWLERHRGKPPGIFPGIFSTLDSLTRRHVHWSFSEKGETPRWLPVSDVAEVEEGDTFFKLPVNPGGWVLVGKPDDVFKLKDGSYHIVDYKTARFTGRQDELFPMYEVQLNSYAYLAEQYGYKPVSKLSLIYCQPNQDLDEDAEFRLSFTTHHLNVDLNPDLVFQLLIRAREIVDQPEPPQPSHKCRGICEWIERA
ncbi:MAG: PD-(D/E)XK nuclease family protein [Candidatus Omnitrophota bacterium]